MAQPEGKCTALSFLPFCPPLHFPGGLHSFACSPFFFSVRGEWIGLATWGCGSGGQGGFPCGEAGIFPELPVSESHAFNTHGSLRALGQGPRSRRAASGGGR